MLSCVTFKKQRMIIIILCKLSFSKFWLCYQAALLYSVTLKSNLHFAHGIRPEGEYKLTMKPNYFIVSSQCKILWLSWPEILVFSSVALKLATGHLSNFRIGGGKQNWSNQIQFWFVTKLVNQIQFWFVQGSTLCLWFVTSLPSFLWIVQINIFDLSVNWFLWFVWCKSFSAGSLITFVTLH